jgi:hypothetical protein
MKEVLLQSIRWDRDGNYMYCQYNTLIFCFKKYTVKDSHTRGLCRETFTAVINSVT